MDYQLPVPSLKHITMVHIGSHILNRRLAAGVRRFGETLPEEFEKWYTLKRHVSHLVNSLPLPKLLLSELWDVIVQLYFQIWDWMEYSNGMIPKAFFLQSPKNIVFRKFYFDVHGEINRKKTLKMYVEAAYFDSNHCSALECFEMACNWCLEDCVLYIWKHMTERDRAMILLYGQYKPLVMYWLDTIKKCDSPAKYLSLCCNEFYNADYICFENLLNYALRSHEKAAVEYFWTKQTDAEKAKNAYDCAKFAAMYKMKNLLCYSLRHLSIEGQIEFFARHSYAIATCFLLWPYDQFFFSALKLMWQTLSVREYVDLFEQIVNKMGTEYGNRFYYLFNEFWCRTPCQLRRQAFDGNESSMRNWHLFMTIKHIRPEVYETLTRDVRALQGVPM